MKRAWGALVRIVTGEWILDWLVEGENGGGVILARAVWTGVLAFALLLLVLDAIDPATPGARERNLKELATDNFYWFAAIFGGTYASLHARFSSQWKYLAGVYNQIKAAEVASSSNQDAIRQLADWKLGFIEDAATLHLYRKPLFASVVAHWGHEAVVQERLNLHAMRAKSRLLRIIDRATVRHEEEHGPLDSQTQSSPPSG